MNIVINIQTVMLKCIAREQNHGHGQVDVPSLELLTNNALKQTNVRLLTTVGMHLTPIEISTMEMVSESVYHFIVRIMGHHLAGEVLKITHGKILHMRIFSIMDSIVKLELLFQQTI